MTGLFLTGSIGIAAEPAYADFANCGQGLREGGDVKLRGVLVGRIGAISRLDNNDCRVRLDLYPADREEIPANAGAQVRAKTIFGEKWVELLLPDDPDPERLATGDIIPIERTIDPLEIETILNVALPLLDAIDPENLAAALDALAGGFAGHEEAAIRAIDAGIEALRPINANKGLAKKGLDLLAEGGEALSELDDDLIAAMDNLDRLNRFTISNVGLIEENLRKAPLLLRELSVLFEARILDLTQLVNQGATVIGVVAARADDLDRLLTVLPKFNSHWIKNLNHQCRRRQGEEAGEEVGGRCWRVHNLLSESQGAYPPGKLGSREGFDYRSVGLNDPDDLDRLLFAPAALRSSL